MLLSQQQLDYLIISQLSTNIYCGSLVRHCEDSTNAWIEQDDVLRGTVDALVVPDNMDLGRVQYNESTSLMRNLADTTMIPM